MNTAAIVRRAEFEVLADLETWADWINTASEQREACEYFGPISTAELLRIANGCPVGNDGYPTDEQQTAARDEAKRRYLADQHQEIKAKVTAAELELEAHA